MAGRLKEKGSIGGSPGRADQRQNHSQGVSAPKRGAPLHCCWNGGALPGMQLEFSSYKTKTNTAH